MIKRKAILIVFISIVSIAFLKAEGRSRYMYSNVSARGGVVYMPILSSGRVIGETQLGLINYEQRPGYIFGVIGSLKMSQRAFIESGFNHQLQILHFSQQKTASFSFINDANEKKTHVRFSSFSIPVRMLFYDSPYRFRRYMSVGAVVNMLYSRRQYETYYFEDNYSVTNAFKNKGGYRMLAPEIRMGFGFEYDLDVDISIKAEPFFGIGFYRGGAKINMITVGLLIAAQLQG